MPPQFQQIADELQQRGGAPPDGAAAPAAGSQAAAAAEGSGVLGGSMGAGADEGAAGVPQAGIGGGGRGSGDGGGGTAPAGAAGAARKYTITPHDGPPAGAEPGQDATQQQQQAQAQQPNGAGPAEPAMVLLVGGQRYHVVNTQLLLLSMLREYAAFRDAVPAFAAEVRRRGLAGMWGGWEWGAAGSCGNCSSAAVARSMCFPPSSLPANQGVIPCVPCFPPPAAQVAQRVLELLKVFNSRTCQLVLGAGAMQVGLRQRAGGRAAAGRAGCPEGGRLGRRSRSLASNFPAPPHPASAPCSLAPSQPQQVSGLKSITAKHLALSCQCLGAFMALHPALAALFTQARAGAVERAPCGSSTGWKAGVQSVMPAKAPLLAAH